MNGLTVSSAPDTDLPLQTPSGTSKSSSTRRSRRSRDLARASTSSAGRRCARSGSEDKQDILRELFAPGVGANFSVCRTPIGANDFSRDWYSYDEVPDDFALEHFSIAKDFDTLVPFIKSALQVSAEAKAVGVAVEPADLDEIQQALRGGDGWTGYAAEWR